MGPQLFSLITQWQLMGSVTCKARALGFWQDLLMTSPEPLPPCNRFDGFFGMSSRISISCAVYNRDRSLSVKVVSLGYCAQRTSSCLQVSNSALQGHVAELICDLRTSSLKVLWMASKHKMNLSPTPENQFGFKSHLLLEMKLSCKASLTVPSCRWCWRYLLHSNNLG